MKIIHFSDTHLGITLENTKREDDFYKNFEKVIDDIIKEKPDFIIHSGDLFHSSKPSNKALSIAISNFLKLQEAGIKVIIIAGNHDTPRLSTTTHSFEIFKELKNFSVFYKEQIDEIEFENIKFILLPHIHNEEFFKEEFKKSVNMINDKKINIFVSHFGISYGEYEEISDEISGVNISLEELEILKKFDYVALGHYHKNFSLPGTNISYSGSLEHTSFNQKNYKNGYNILHIEEKKLSKKLIELETRKMVDLGEIDVSIFENTDNLIEYLEQKIDKELIKDAIVKISFINMNNKLLLDFRENLIYNFFENTFYFEYKKFKIQNTENNFGKNIKESSDIINDNFSSFLDEYDLGEKNDKKELLKKELKEILKTTT